MAGRNTGAICIHDSVVLNSGGPDMSVVGVMPRDTSAYPYLMDCMCCWEHEGALEYAVFPDACLKHVYHYLKFDETSESEYEIDGIDQDGELESSKFYGQTGAIYLSDTPIDILNPGEENLLWDARGIFWRLDEQGARGNLRVRLRANQFDQVKKMLSKNHLAVLLRNFNEIGVALQTENFQVLDIGGSINHHDVMDIGCTFTCKNIKTYIMEKEDV